MGAIKWLFNQHQFLQLSALTTKTVTVKAVRLCIGLLDEQEELLNLASSHYKHLNKRSDT